MGLGPLVASSLRSGRYRPGAFVFLNPIDFNVPWSNYYWRASEASETLSGVYKFELVRYIYMYIYMYGGTYAIIVAHATHT